MDYDIAIIGAGPAGLSFACSLRDSGLNIAVIEKLSKTELADPARVVLPSAWTPFDVLELR